MDGGTMQQPPAKEFLRGYPPILKACCPKKADAPKRILQGKELYGIVIKLALLV